MNGYQSVIITGASSGIGEELAKRFARRGAKVGLIARRQENLLRIQKEISSQGGQAWIAPLDIGDRDRVLEGIETLKHKMGPPDLLIANAGIGGPIKMSGFDSRKVADIMNVNVMGVMHALDGVLPQMLEAGKGHIVGISSLSAYISFQRIHAYAASKACLSHFLNGVRVELSNTPVAVSTICPGYIKTPMTDGQKGMMFLMPLDEACDRIEKAIDKKIKVYDFPKRAAWTIKAMNCLPDGMLRRLTGGK